MVSHPGVTYSHALLAGLAEQGATLVVCDGKRLPTGLLAPLTGHSTQSERFSLQIAASQPVKKQLWQQIIRAKILSQASLLTEIHGNDYGLSALAGMVKSGDAGNMEARASRRYWPVIFGDTAFRRDRNREDQNRFLNYGYAVLRAVCTRAICAAGLNPSYGIFHHNRYDPFPLADDLMEPFRVFVDRGVYKLTVKNGADAPMDRETKKEILSTLTGRLTIKNEERTLFDVLARLASSLALVFEGRKKKLSLPDF